MEEQGSATREIASSVSNASQGTNEASERSMEIREIADESQHQAGALAQASKNMANSSQSLRGSVDQFLNEVRS